MSDAHLIAQVAACRAGVGIALRPHPHVLELRGAPEHLALAVRDGRLHRVAHHRALLLLLDDGAPAVLGLDVAVLDVSAEFALLDLAGPQAAALAARFPDPVLVAADGDQRRLIVVGARRGPIAWRLLLEAGRRHGTVAVDARAIDLHLAARPALITGAGPA